MKEQVPELYSEYGRYINGFRAFPLIYDGLKIVERRLLYSLYQQAREHYTKSAKVVGYCIGNYHPHGDVSAYMSLVSMVQGGLADGQGNWGSNIGVTSCDAAAQRYTEVRSSKEILRIAFEFIKYVDLEALELDPEPVALPSKLPICLINKNNCQGIGFGSRTIIPSYSKSDLIKRLKWLLGYRSTEPLIKPISDCTGVSPDSAYKELLTTGRSKLDYQGLMEVDGPKSVIVKSLPPGKSFVKVMSQMEKEIQIEKAVGWTDETSGATGTRVRFTILRQRGYKIEKLQKKLKKLLAGSITYECNMCDENGKVVLVSIDQMLLNVYNHYKSIVEKYLNVTIAEIQASIDEMELIQKIKVVLPIHLQATPNDPEAIIRNCSTDTSIPEATVKQLFDKYNISRLLRVQVNIAEEKEKKLTFEEKLANLESFVWEDKYAGES